MDVGTIAVLRNALQGRNVSAAQIYDVNWWLYATSDANREDRFLKGYPNEGTSLLKRLDVQAYKKTYKRFIDGKTTKRARLQKLVEFTRVNARHPYTAEDTELSWATLSARLNNDALIHELREKFTDVDIRPFFDAINAIHVQQLINDEITSRREQVNLGFALGPCALSKRINERYPGMQFVVDLNGSAMARTATGQYVLVYDPLYYNVRRFNYVSARNTVIPQPRITNAIRSTIVSRRMDTDVHVVDIGEFDGTLHQELERCDDAGRRTLLDGVFSAIQGYEGEVAHGRVSPSILLVRDGVVHFTDFSTSKRKRSSDASEVRVQLNQGRPVVNTYVHNWDVLYLVVCLLMDYPPTSAVGAFVREYLPAYINDGYASKSCAIQSVDGNVTIIQFTVVDDDGRASGGYTLTLTWDSAKSVTETTIQNAVEYTVEIEFMGEMIKIDGTPFKQRGIVISTPLGEGAYGTVFEVEGRDDVVAKISNVDGATFTRETDLQRRAAALGFAPHVYHSFAAQVIFDPIDIIERSRVCVIVMQRMATTLGRFMYDSESDVDDIHTVVRSAVDTVERFGLSGFMHHDLKLDNIMLDKDNRVYIIDYGMAWYAGSDGRTPYGYYRYESPNEKPEDDMNLMALPAAFNIVGWLPWGVRNASNIYDLVSLFKFLCDYMDILGSPMSDDIVGVVEKFGEKYWRQLFTDIADKLYRPMSAKDTVEITDIENEGDGFHVIITYVEHPVPKSEDRSTNVWRVYTSNNTVVKEEDDGNDDAI